MKLNWLQFKTASFCSCKPPCLNKTVHVHWNWDLGSIIKVNNKSIGFK